MQNQKVDQVTRKNISAFIQFTKIAPGVTRQEIEEHLELCKEYNFQAAMIAPCWIPLAQDILKGTNVKIASYIDFGMGNASIQGKVAQLQSLREGGVDEVDYAPNMGFLLSGMVEEFEKEARELVRAAGKVQLKAMLQMGMIGNENEKASAIRILEDAGVNWIKNSSGGWPPGATNASVEDISFIKKTIKGKSRIKASVGIKTFDQAVALINAGAELLGTSSGIKIVGDLDHQSSDDHSISSQY